MSTLIKFFRQKLPPQPRFDRVAVRDLRVFHSIPRRDPAPSIAGIPVVQDESIEVGVIELRKGDEVIERVLLSELRA